MQSTQVDFTQGSLQQTGGSLDVAIQGNGFFQVKDPSGSIYYTRAGNFSRNAQGAIVVGSANIGRLLEPSITIPADATAITISTAGVVSYQVPGNQQLTQAGTFQLASFINPQGLLQIGENLYQETEASGAATTAARAQRQRTRDLRTGLAGTVQRRSSYVVDRPDHYAAVL